MQRCNDQTKLINTINIITGIATMIIQLMVSFFLSPFIVENIGEAANGFTQLANNIVSYATLISLAFNSMASRFISVNFHKGNNEKVKRYFTATVVCNVLISIILIPISLYIVFKLDSFIVIGDSDFHDVQMLFACVFFNYIFSLISSVYSISFYVMNKVYMQNIINLIRNIANAALLLLVFSSLPIQMYYVSMVACMLSLIIIPIYMLCQERYMPFLKCELKYFKFSTIKELFKSGIWNTVNQCGNMLMTGLDLLLSNLYINPISMGILAVSKTIPNAIIQLASVLNSSFAPSLTENWAKGDDNEILSQLRSGMKVSSVILSIPIITFCVFSTQFYQLWMPTMDSTTLAFLSFLACLQFIPWTGPQILYNVFTTTNKLKLNSLTFLLSGFINLGLVWVLLNTTSLGAYAIAGVSSVISIIRNMLFTAPYAAKLLKLKWNTFYVDVMFSIVCCGINAGIGYSIKLLLNYQGWIGLIIMVVVTCIITFIIEILIILNKEERTKILNKIVRK